MLYHVEHVDYLLLQLFVGDFRQALFCYRVDIVCVWLVVGQEGAQLFLVCGKGLGHEDECLPIVLVYALALCVAFCQHPACAAVGRCLQQVGRAKCVVGLDSVAGKVDASQLVMGGSKAAVGSLPKGMYIVNGKKFIVK